MQPIIDHVGIKVADLERAKAFYSQALAPLGIRLLMGHGTAAGFGRDKPEFWLGAGKSDYQATEVMDFSTPVHVCLSARTRAEVDAFHAAALAAGGRDNGAPGIRAHYHPGYYGAFVIDLDGHNVEAVHHEFP